VPTDGRVGFGMCGTGMQSLQPLQNASARHQNTELDTTGPSSHYSQRPPSLQPLHLRVQYTTCKRVRSNPRAQAPKSVWVIRRASSTDIHQSLVEIDCTVPYPESILLAPSGCLRLDLQCCKGMARAGVTEACYRVVLPVLLLPIPPEVADSRPPGKHQFEDEAQHPYSMPVPRTPPNNRHCLSNSASPNFNVNGRQPTFL